MRICSLVRFLLVLQSRAVLHWSAKAYLGFTSETCITTGGKPCILWGWNPPWNHKRKSLWNSFSELSIKHDVINLWTLTQCLLARTTYNLPWLKQKFPVCKHHQLWFTEWAAHLHAARVHSLSTSWRNQKREGSIARLIERGTREDQHGRMTTLDKITWSCPLIHSFS